MVYKLLVNAMHRRHPDEKTRFALVRQTGCWHAARAMSVHPEIFISAASRDLKSCRQMVRDTLLTLGCVPVVQDNFPPGAGEVRAMLRERIAACHAVIHLAGVCYGHEPQERSAELPRRSYTQMEYDIARELGKPLYTFLCEPDFHYDPHTPEAEELQLLQQKHRAALLAGDQLYMPVHDSREVSERVREMQTRVEVLTKDLQRTRNWLARGVAAAVVGVILVAGLIYAAKRQSEAAQARAEQRTAQLETQLADLLRQQTQLTSLVTAKLDPNAATGTNKADPSLAARGEAARQLGISVDDLQKRLADEHDDVRALLTRIDQGSAAEAAKATEWKKLKRAALTELGDAENVEGHYADEIDPYQQALALTDKEHEPLVWCDMARNLERAFWRMGCYAQAEPLARELVEKRTSLQGAEHPDTLTGIHNLANVLYLKGDLTGAEKLFRSCLEARRRILGPENPDTLKTLSNLANVLYVRGDLAGAEPLIRQCLEIRERTLGPDNSDTLASLHNLANVLAQKGDLVGAETLFRRCVDSREHALGPDHPDTLKDVLTLAEVLALKGDIAGAEALFRRCVATNEKTLGPEHPDTLQNLQSLADLLILKRDFAGAVAILRRCEEVGKRTLGPDHPFTLRSTGDLAKALDAKGDYPAAEELYRAAQAGMDRVLAPGNPGRLELDHNFSLMLIKQGRLAEALPLAEHAASAAAGSLPANSADRLIYEKALRDLRAELPAGRQVTRTQAP